MESYVIATVKSWNLNNAYKLKGKYPNDNIHIIDYKDALSYDYLREINPRYIFFPHWSWYIPKDIYENFECVVFHMADLPYGRGGSPLQNQIIRGIYQTKISAIKACGELDAGDIYLKYPIDISYGNADEILQMVSEIVFNKMIPCFIQEKLLAKPQVGDILVFERRNPTQSRIPQGLTMRQLYDYIRMLDGEGYPTAYLETEYGKFYFKNAEFKDGKLISEVNFEVKE